MTGQDRYIDETLRYFDMPNNVTVDTKDAKSILVRTMENNKMWVMEMLNILVDSTKLPHYILLKRKIFLKRYYLPVFG